MTLSRRKSALGPVPCNRRSALRPASTLAPVSSLPASAATAVALFAATNVDDLVVLALLSATSRAAGRPRRWEIWVGQYLGFAVLVGPVPRRRARPVPGPGPLALAARPDPAHHRRRHAGRRDQVRAPGRAADPPGAGQPSGTGLSGMAGPSGVGGLPVVPGLSNVRWLSWMAGVVGVATLTVVDGADNLAAYTPVFATADAGRIAVTLVVFAVGVAVWCAAGALLTRHHRITDTLPRYGRWILPAAFILIGLYTLHATNAPIHL